MVDILAFAVLGLIIGGAAGYVYKAKKRGVRCVGCPHSESCGGNCSCPEK